MFLTHRNYYKELKARVREREEKERRRRTKEKVISVICNAYCDRVRNPEEN
jgi:hypothetical protein